MRKKVAEESYRGFDLIVTQLGEEDLCDDEEGPIFIGGYYEPNTMSSTGGDYEDEHPTFEECLVGLRSAVDEAIAFEGGSQTCI